jgi:hypothetical protein
MKLIVITQLVIFFTIQLSLIYADSSTPENSNFTYQQILANRLERPLPFSSQINTTGPLDFTDTEFINKQVQNSGLLRFFLFREDSFSRNTFNYFWGNQSGDLVFVNFGQYANLSLNYKNALMNNEFLQISIPFGSWNKTTNKKQASH